ncbi:MAG TPA: histidine kinase dimerization/phospho-acceptor domain-containing protein [Kofleriaceae bacterium]|nr:histidine kinase dimerization/phospho-acceptor domain-containing protein [Kofleriaceae bacterium]
MIVAAVPLVGISFAEMHETQLLGALEDDMIHQAELVRAITAAEPGRALADYEPMLEAAAATTRTRIRLLDATGAVVADSHRSGPPEGPERAVPRLLHGRTPARESQPPQPLDPSSRREVQAALAGRYGSATRRWDHQGRVYLFSALPIVRPGVRPGVQPGPGGAAGPVAGVVYVTRSTTDVKLQLYRLRTWLFRLLAATLALTALVTLVLATTIARPLGRLTRRAQRIASGQPIDADDRAERALTGRADEIGQLARAVTAMTDELQRRARDARTLAADLSHEFKTPLTGIRGAAELLRDGASDDPDARDRFLAMILDDAARLDRLVSRLLELARVEDDRGIELPVALDALAHACARRSWPVPVEVDTGDSAGDAPGDARDGDHALVVPGRAAPLTAALDNLVANATQFAAPGTAVRIALTRRAAAIRLAVANHGPALSPAARAQVWDRFYSTRVAASGSGLGLAIVRSVALGHGGQVGVECDAGVTVFWLELPVAGAR